MLDTGSGFVTCKTGMWFGSGTCRLVLSTIGISVLISELWAAVVIKGFSGRSGRSHVVR